MAGMWSEADNRRENCDSYAWRLEPTRRIVARPVFNGHVDGVEKYGPTMGQVLSEGT